MGARAQERQLRAAVRAWADGARHTRCRAALRVCSLRLGGSPAAGARLRRDGLMRLRAAHLVNRWLNLLHARVQHMEGLGCAACSPTACSLTAARRPCPAEPSQQRRLLQRREAAFVQRRQARALARALTAFKEARRDAARAEAAAEEASAGYRGALLREGVRAWAAASGQAAAAGAAAAVLSRCAQAQGACRGSGRGLLCSCAVLPMQPGARASHGCRPGCRQA